MGHEYNKRGMRFLLSTTTALTLIGFTSIGAYAQESSTDNTSAVKSRNSLLLDEVIVTAQKKSENVQSVGIAITALNGDQLEKLGIENSTEIAKFTPSVSISGSFAGQQQQYVIRGVTQNDFNDHVESPNAVYIDEGYVAAQQGSIFATFDIERVEVLKGPQGTLFGRNATGGLVHYLTRKPTDNFEGYVKARYGSYNQIRLEGAMGGPISDKVRYRVSGMFNKYDGYLKNEYPENTFTPVGVQLNDGPQLPGVGADLGGDETWALRGHLELDTSDSSTLLLSASYTETITSVGPYQSAPSIAVLNAAGGHINTLRPDPTETREIIGPGGIAIDSAFDGDSDGVRPLAGADFFGYVDPDGNGFRTSSDFALDDIGRFKTLDLIANFNKDFDNGVSFTSITDYKYLDKFQALDLEAGPADQLIWFGDATIKSFTQEFRLAGDYSKGSWVAGLYYLNIDTFSATSFGALSSSIFNAFGNQWDLPNIVDLKTNSYSAFGQFDYELSTNLKFIGGLRVTLEEKDFDYEIRFIPDAPNPLAWDFDAPGIPFREYEGASSDTLITGKAQLEWTPLDNVLIYTGFNRGVKAGSFNASGTFDATVFTDEEIPYTEEILHAYEFGFKSTLAGGLAQLNGAVYYYDYKDYQASRWNGLGNEITNNDAIIKGFEIDLKASPINNLDVTVGYGYVDATVKDVLIAGIPHDVRPTFAPEHTFSALARYAVPDVAGGELALQASVSYQSEIYHNLNNFDANLFDSWTVADARISWDKDDGSWGISVFGNNIFDERYNVIGFDLSQLCGCNEEAQGKPRWWGVNIKKSFGG